MHTESEQLFFEGGRHLQAGDLPAAASCLHRACTLSPGFGQAWANLGLVRDRQGDTIGAEAAYRSALDAGCDAFELQLNYGAMLAAQRRLDEALACYARALQQDNSSASLWSNLGALYLALQEDDDAQTCLEKALQLQNDHASAHTNLAYLHLRHGRFEEGWRAFEARNWYTRWAARMSYTRWMGESLAGKTVLLCEEAGHGDMIQFVRYVPLLKALGAQHITLLCQPALLDLLDTMEGVDAVLSVHAPAPSADYWSPLLSLPYYLQTRAANIPARIPYLQADTDRTAFWQDQWRHWTRTAQPLRVGLVWKGNPAFENDAMRSLPHLRTLLPLLEVPGVAFVSLQKGGEHEVQELQTARKLAGHGELDLHDAAATLSDFADSAVLISTLDLVIAVDTAVAHLAGALGKPCWLLLPDYMADWRWGTNAGPQATQTAWYPHTMRLWRQDRHGDWPPLIATVATALQGMSTKRHDTTT